MSSPEFPYALLDRPDAKPEPAADTPPLDRHAVEAQRQIRQWMADDFAALIRERGEDAVITIDDLIALGWTRRQVVDHGAAAAALAAHDEQEAA